MLVRLLLSFYKLSTQILIVLLREIFVNEESMSRLAVSKLRFWQQISSAKWKESTTVYSLAVEGFQNLVKPLLFCR